VVAARFAQRRVEDEDLATHLVCDHDVFESHILWT
jgi:hypothetical protein